MPASVVLCLMGPTASGKTALALELAEYLPVTIISVDSALVYRGMDIGTAKPTQVERQRVPHALIDICPPWQPYSAGDFVKDAKREITQAHSAGKLPLLVGGTMLYFHALQQGLATLPQANASLRAELVNTAEQQGWLFLYEQLQQFDPTSAARIHQNDKQRIQRALEIFRLTGVPASELQATAVSQGIHQRYRVLNIGLLPTDRALAHEQVADRYSAMLEQGLLDEVKALMQLPAMHADLPAMRAVGYRQAWQFLIGELNNTEMKQQAVQATRQLLKRQLTWLRRWHDLTVFQVPTGDLVAKVIDHLRAQGVS